MQKSTNRFCNGGGIFSQKALLLTFLIAALPVALYAQSSYQSLADKVSVNFENTNAAVVVKSLEKQTAYTFTYDPDYLQHCSLSAVKFNHQSLGDVLHYLDVYAPIDIVFANNTVALRQGKQERAAGQDKGKVSGKIVDSKNEPLPGVTILAENGQGAVTNVDGTYELSLDPGVHTLTFSYVSFDTKKVTEINVKEKTITPLDIVMKSSGSRLKEVTVTGSYKRASVEGLYAIQKNNAAITDGISAEQISRTPDKNIGEVLKRVSGLSTMDNKYIVVRGLSERYNQSVLNGQIMPSTELNRKNFSFDIVPSNIVDNVTVVKTLTADRSAEFGGGLVEVNTLDVPKENFFTITAGGTVNSNTTGKAFLSTQLEGKEYFGQVSDHRKLFGSLDWKNTQDITAKYNANNKSADMFSNNWGLYQFKAQPSQNYQLTFGHVFNGQSSQHWGLVASAGYRNTLATQNVRMSRDGFEADSSQTDYAGFTGKRFGFTTNIGGLLGIGFKDARNAVNFETLYLQTLDQQLIFGTGLNTAGIVLGYYDLTNQTKLWQNQLKGEHSIGSKGVKIKWNGSLTHLDRQKPDNHQFLAPYVRTDSSSLGGYSIYNPLSNGSEYGALRWWSRALENNANWDASVSVPFKFGGKTSVNSVFKGGYAGWYKDRLFYVLNVGTNFSTQGGYPQPLAEAFTAANNTELRISNFHDDFHRYATLHAAYGMLDNKIGNKLRFVFGLRAEYYNLNNTNAALDSLFSLINANRGGNNKYDYSDLKNREPNLNWFPSANLTYSLTPSMNLRLAYSKSIIRPDLRELSFFREYDFELGGIYESQLVRSSIAHHYDFRYEWYPGPGEILSASLFYKKFNYPMEIYADTQSGGIFDLQNNKSAENYGLELEARKSLSFIDVPVIRNITLYANFTALDAYVTTMKVNYNSLNPNDPTKITPVEAIGKRERRPQTGASNYIVNAGFYYDYKWVSLSLVYNYVSNRMFRPDAFYQFSLFERPLESLDAQLAVHLLKNKADIKLNIANLLNSFSVVYSNKYTDPDILSGKKQPTTKQLLYQAKDDQIDYLARPGVTTGLTLSYRF
jgi:outer membrane receptor protein involved in Fe transport